MNSPSNGTVPDERDLLCQTIMDSVSNAKAMFHGTRSDSGMVKLRALEADTEALMADARVAASDRDRWTNRKKKAPSSSSSGDGRSKRRREPGNAEYDDLYDADEPTSIRPPRAKRDGKGKKSGKQAPVTSNEPPTGTKASALPKPAGNLSYNANVLIYKTKVEKDKVRKMPYSKLKINSTTLTSLFNEISSGSLVLKGLHGEVAASIPDKNNLADQAKDRTIIVDGLLNSDFVKSRDNYSSIEGVTNEEFWEGLITWIRWASAENHQRIQNADNPASIRVSIWVGRWLGAPASYLQDLKAAPAYPKAFLPGIRPAKPIVDPVVQKTIQKVEIIIILKEKEDLAVKVGNTTQLPFFDIKYPTLLNTFPTFVEALPEKNEDAPIDPSQQSVSDLDWSIILAELAKDAKDKIAQRVISVATFLDSPLARGLSNYGLVAHMNTDQFWAGLSIIFDLCVTNRWAPPVRIDSATLDLAIDVAKFLSVPDDCLDILKGKKADFERKSMTLLQRYVK